MTATARFELRDLAATQEFGRRLAGLLFPGAVVALIGSLGAGKTHLTRAIAEGLGVPDPRIVTSPTFVLQQEYPGGRLVVHHFDAYRLRGAAEFDDLDAQEYLEGSGVCVVEWADRVAGSLPAERLLIHLAITGETSRLARVEGVGRRYEEIVRLLESA